MTTNFSGRDGYSFFTGVVEDRNDPLEIGRVRVRCLGYHTENKTELPTSDLPWASVMAPTTSPSMSGLGQTPSFLVEGSWVVGFFRDVDLQEPLIMGSLPGIPSTLADTKQGFNDPNGVYPREKDVSDVNDMARGDTAADSIVLRDGNRSTNLNPATFSGFSVNTASGTTSAMGHTTISSFDEPPIIDTDGSNGTYKPVYPKNHVLETESGHSLSFDDTDNQKRISLVHAAGSYIDVHNGGNRVDKTVGDLYNLTSGVSHTHVGDQMYITTGNHLMIRANDEEKMHNCITIQVGKQGHINIVTDDGNLHLNINGDVKQKVTGNMSVNVSGDYYMEADGEIELKGKNIHLNK